MDYNYLDYDCKKYITSRFDEESKKALYSLTGKWYYKKDYSRFAFKSYNTRRYSKNNIARDNG